MGERERERERERRERERKSVCVRERGHRNQAGVRPNPDWVCGRGERAECNASSSVAGMRVGSRDVSWYQTCLFLFSSSLI